MARDAWMPERSINERLARAIDSMSPGSARGRIAQASPVRDRRNGSAESLDDEMGAREVLFCNTDRKIALAPGTIVLRLSHVPIDGSLHVYWNGRSQSPAHWSLIGNMVTIPDVLGRFRYKDEFSAAYAYYDDGLVPSPSAIVRSTGSLSYGAPGIINGSLPLALPAGTQIGDLIVVAQNGCTMSDSRLVAVGNCMHIGFATNLNPIAAVAAGTFYAIACTTAQIDGSNGWSPAQVASNGAMNNLDTLVVPSVGDTTVAFNAMISWSTFGVNNMSTPAGYTMVTPSCNSGIHAHVDIWTNDTPTSSPATPSTYYGGTGGAQSTVVGLV